jgi:hypothetical protein
MLIRERRAVEDVMAGNGELSNRRCLARGTPGPAGRWWHSGIALLAFVLATACQSPQILSTQQSGALISKTKLGMSRDEVVGQLGPPHKRETYEATEFLFYNTNWAMADAAAQQSPVAIVEGKVVGLGTSFYKAFVKSHGVWTGGEGVVEPEK